MQSQTSMLKKGWKDVEKWLIWNLDVDSTLFQRWKITCARWVAPLIHRSGPRVCRSWIDTKKHVGSWRGFSAPPTPKLACFPLFFKTTNTFLKNNMYILKFFKKLKNGTETFSRPSNLEVMDQNSQNVIWIKNKNSQTWHSS